MAGPLQVGDLISLGRLAWDVYRYGWSEDHNATSQYADFGRYVGGLAENLDILSRVIVSADNSLQNQTLQGVPSRLRWDKTSLIEIIGDYEMTLRECNQLLISNNRYRMGSNAFSNLEWNLLVQPKADQLRQRIMLHNSKILHVLKPFEVDLLLRVRQDIERMHQDLADRITAVHRDIRRLMGVLIPDLDEALDQRDQRSVFLLEVPADLDNQFRLAALSGHGHPDCRTEENFELGELSDAFVLNFNKSTINFKSGMLVEHRMPTVDQYLNLLKCVWIYRRIQTSPALRGADKDTSHWPSYARQLEDDLSSQCARFGPELLTPRIVTSTLKRDMFTIWPEKEPTNFVVTQDEMMEQLLEVPLQSYSTGLEKKAKLLRRLPGGRGFRIIISGSTQATSGNTSQRTEIIDLDTTSMVFNPQYALPTATHMAQEIILRQNERIAKLDFINGGDILKFQQAVTGFKPWASVTQYDCQVIYVLGGVKETIMENASLQLWIPKSTEGSLVTNSDAAASTARTSSTSRQNSISTLVSGAMPISPVSGSRPFASPGPMASSYGNAGDVFSAGPTGRPPSLPTIPQRQPTMPELYGSWPERSSPEPIRPSTVERQNFFPIPGPPRQSPPRKPVGQTPSPRRSGSFLTPLSNTTTATNNGRSFSISSDISSNSNSSSSDVHSVSISTGTNSTGLLHKRPVKPMLVLFTQNRQGDRFSFVTIQIDDKTNINPERCNCRRSGRDGASCDIAAIEKKKGDIAARRYEQSTSDGDMDWNLARLSLNNPASTNNTADWPNLKRLSIRFPTAQARSKFCGMPSVCRCKIKNEGDMLKCLQERHRGLWGEVQEHYRKQMNNFHRQRYESRSHVVYGVTS